MNLEPSDGVVVTTAGSPTTVSNRNCIVTAVSLNPAAAACTVSLYDPPVNTTTTTNATLRVTLSAPASTLSACLPLPSGVQFLNGCIAVVTGAGATATIASKKI
jgi:hypothetical protein